MSLPRNEVINPDIQSTDYRDTPALSWPLVQVATIAAGGAANVECGAHRLLLSQRQVYMRITSRSSGGDFAAMAESREECDDICEVRLIINIPQGNTKLRLYH